ncbi:hypothetical protein [Neptuniibacter sp. QD48_11]|uniref:hypothetical protein n=1 Tax=Neptuniibacter sp. QD48_11 TaxID=3398211 RepID=UPI0039F53EC0
MTDTTKNDNAVTSTEGVTAPIEYTLLKEAKATKLSPKNRGELTYQIAQHPDSKKLFIRILSNDTGGYFSKEWINVEAMQKVLIEQDKDKPLKSGIFKPLFTGGSSNNSGFCAAVCRAEKLLKPAPDSAFLHMLDKPFSEWLKSIEKLKPIGKAEDLTKPKAVAVDKTASTSSSTKPEAKPTKSKGVFD